MFIKQVLLYMYEYFACIYLCTVCIPGAHGDKKKAYHPLELQLEFMNNDVGAGN